MAEFRKQVPYRKDVLFNAKIIYENVKERTNCSSCTMVSVHLRLGDYTKMMHEQNFPAIVSETNYLSNAFNYIIENYSVSQGYFLLHFSNIRNLRTLQDPVFYVMGEFHLETRKAVDILRDEFKTSKIVIPGEIKIRQKLVKGKRLYIGMDLALISMADVAILTYGSFGDFGGLLYKDKREVLFPLGHPSHNETGVNFGVPTFKGITWKLNKL